MSKSVGIVSGQLSALVDRCGSGELALAAMALDAAKSGQTTVHVVCRADLAALESAYEGTGVELVRVKAGALCDVEMGEKIAKGRALVVVSDLRRCIGLGDPFAVCEDLEGLSARLGVPFVLEFRRAHGDLLDGCGTVLECVDEAHAEAGVRCLRLHQTQRPRGAVEGVPDSFVVIESDGSMALHSSPLSRAQRAQADQAADAMLESLLDAPGRLNPQLDGVTFDVCAAAVAGLVARGDAVIRMEVGAERVYPSAAAIERRRHVDAAVFDVVEANPYILVSGVAQRAGVTQQDADGAITRLINAGRIVRGDNDGKPCLESAEHRRHRDAVSNARTRLTLARRLDLDEVALRMRVSRAVVEEAAEELRKTGDVLALDDGGLIYYPRLERDVIEALEKAKEPQTVLELARTCKHHEDDVQAVLNRYCTVRGFSFLGHPGWSLRMEIRRGDMAHVWSIDKDEPTPRGRAGSRAMSHA